MALSGKWIMFVDPCYSTYLQFTQLSYVCATQLVRFVCSKVLLI